MVIVSTQASDVACKGDLRRSTCSLHVPFLVLLPTVLTCHFLSKSIGRAKDESTSAQQAVTFVTTSCNKTLNSWYYGRSATAMPAVTYGEDRKISQPSGTNAVADICSVSVSTDC